MSGQHESLKEALWQMQILRRGGGEGGEVGDALHSFHVYTLFIIDTYTPFYFYCNCH